MIEKLNDKKATTARHIPLGSTRIPVGRMQVKYVIGYQIVKIINKM